MSPRYVSSHRSRKLASCEVTHHALDSYLNRVPEARADGARDELAGIAAGATFYKLTPFGEEIWRAKTSQGRRLRLVVQRIARRAPILLTVMCERAS